jgi:WhiB family transcriptional regulator, redox-sensing transcriptional regulator
MPGLNALRSLPTELFYPIGHDRDRWDPQALAACAACAVRKECLQWAIEHGEQGIWAGIDEQARAAIRRRQRESSRRST